MRARVNDPTFSFGRRAAHIAAKNEPLLELLLAAGADVNLKSRWENGPYTVLDHADERTAHYLMARGATLTPNVAARLGWLDELERLVVSSVDRALSAIVATWGGGHRTWYAIL